MKIVCAMSGGVDSSTAAALLKKEGHEVIGMHVKIWKDEKEASSKKQCCTIEGVEQARRTCQRLHIPFYVVDVGKKFKKHVVDYFIKTYTQGCTPNPCIECNRHIRFGFMLEQAKKLGATHLATGHYARIKIKNGKYELWRAKDNWKDQTYFLYTLTQKTLQHVIFPLGNYTKQKVREMAKKFGLREVHRAPESQNICFFTDRRYQDFFKRQLSKKALRHGPIIRKNGQKLGEHEGIVLYTVGQRQGLKLGGQKKALYVLEIDVKKNALIVGTREELCAKKTIITKTTFISGKPPKIPAKICVKIRHPGAMENAVLEAGGKVIFQKPVFGVTKGQSLVMYEGGKVIGGGIIKAVS